MTHGQPVFSPTPEPVPFAPDPRAVLPHAAEVVVVGGGMLGASAAYHLARAGMRPLLIEANAPASGASGRNAGMALAGLGGHFGRVNSIVQDVGGRSILDYTTRSLDMIESWDAELPGGLEWDRFGSLDLALDDVEEAHIRHMAEIQAAEGLEVRVVDDRAELRELATGLATDAVRAAKWTARDAKLNPFRLCYALLEATRALGGTVVTGVRVERLQASGGRVSGVSTSHGEVAAGAVLLATNAWTPALAPHLAANLTPIRETVCVTEMLPVSIGAPGFETNQCNEYWRQMRTGEVVIGGYAVADEGMGIGSYSTRVRPQVAPRLADLLARLHPALRDARIIRCWAGLLDFASLEIPMAGSLPAEDGTPLPGAFVAAGLTGHGHPYAPILGLLLAELIAEKQARTLSLAPFDPTRYVGVTHAPTWLDPFRGTEAPTPEYRSEPA
ncbi:MAG TPA: FAD-binding oxidoreductase [Candidatus Limnocylindrales bacterium]|nr:FAD-binding oxidoreductase [Candidatus Limnocylindrales bacterium]